MECSGSVKAIGGRIPDSRDFDHPNAYLTGEDQLIETFLHFILLVLYYFPAFGKNPTPVVLDRQLDEI